VICTRRRIDRIDLRESNTGSRNSTPADALRRIRWTCGAGWAPQYFFFAHRSAIIIAGTGERAREVTAGFSWLPARHNLTPLLPINLETLQYQLQKFDPGVS